MRTESSGIFRIAVWSAYTGAVVSAVGVASLLLLYLGFFTNVESLLVFGPLNDVLVVVQYLLALPVAVALHRVLKAHSASLSLAAMLIAFVGVAGAVVSQLLLLSGVMPFSEQVVYASTFLLVVGVWIAITGVLGRRTGTLQLSVPTIVLGALYVGYPLWVYRVGQQIRSRDRA